MDSYFNKELFRQDLQDFQDCFYLSHFPDGNEKTQSPAANQVQIL